MLKALMYFNAVCITVAFVVGALLRIGEIFRKDEESQEKNDVQNLNKTVKKISKSRRIAPQDFFDML